MALQLSLLGNVFRIQVPSLARVGVNNRERSPVLIEPVQSLLNLIREDVPQRDIFIDIPARGVDEPVTICLCDQVRVERNLARASRLLLGTKRGERRIKRQSGQISGTGRRTRNRGS